MTYTGKSLIRHKHRVLWKRKGPKSAKRVKKGLIDKEMQF